MSPQIPLKRYELLRRHDANGLGLKAERLGLGPFAAAPHRALSGATFPTAVTWCLLEGEVDDVDDDELVQGDQDEGEVDDTDDGEVEDDESDDGEVEDGDSDDGEVEDGDESSTTDGA